MLSNNRKVSQSGCQIGTIDNFIETLNQQQLANAYKSECPPRFTPAKSQCLYLSLNGTFLKRLSRKQAD